MPRPLCAQECKSLERLATLTWRDVRLDVAALQLAREVDLADQPLRDDGVIVACALLKVHA